MITSSANPIELLLKTLVLLLKTKVFMDGSCIVCIVRPHKDLCNTHYNAVISCYFTDQQLAAATAETAMCQQSQRR